LRKLQVGGPQILIGISFIFGGTAVPKKVLDQPYIIHEDEDSPLALTGDYFEGNTIEHAYQSGYLLARHWIEKYP
jgi:predicted NAD/FAD-dependent oxidoreductase